MDAKKHRPGRRDPDRARKDTAKPGNAGESLRQFEERLEGVLALSADWYWEQDEELRFTHFSGKTFAAAGFEPESLIGKTRWEIPGAQFDPAERAAVQAKMDAREPFVDHEYKRVGSDGTVRYIRASGQPAFDDKGRFRGYRGIAKDVTQSRRADQLLALEHEVNRCLAEAGETGAVLKAVIRAVCKSEEWECGQYWRWDDRAGVLRFGEFWSVPSSKFKDFLERSRDVTFAPGVGLIGSVLQSGQPLWVADVTRDPRVLRSKIVREIGLHGAFVFPPVNSEGKTIGVLAFSSSHIRAPDERLLQAVRVIASQIGQFLQRKQAEEEQLRFRAAMDASADLITLVDRDTLRYVDVNASACEVHGYSREEMLKKGPLDFSAQTREDLERSYDETIASGKATRTESHQNRRDGTRVPVEVLRRAVRSGGRWIIVAIVRDLSERKRAEDLQKLEHSVAHSIADAESIATAMTAAIRAICETEGWECGRYFRPDEDGDTLRLSESWGLPDAAIERYLAGSRNITYAPGVGLVGRVWESGQPLWVSDLSQDARTSQAKLASASGMRGAFVFPILSGGKAIGVLAFNSRDVRKSDERLLEAIRVIGSQIGQFLQRKRVEEEQRRFRVALDHSADMIVLIDRATMRFVDVNETACRLLGYSKEELLKMGPQDVLPTSRADLERVYDEFIANPSQIHGMQSRYRRKDGSTFPFESTRHVLRSGDGYLIAAISRDISARVAAEEDLLRFRAAMDTSADMIMLVDRATMRYIDVNATACEMQGYTREEMLQMGPQDVSPAARETLERSYDESIASGETTQLQSFHRRKDGTRIPVEIFRRAVRSGERWIIVAIVRDITQRVAAEQALRESEERFRSLTQLSSDMYWEQDDQYRFTSMTGTGSDRVNVRASAVIGKKRWEQNYVNMSADDWAKHIATLDARQRFYDLELCRLDESGNKVWINASGEPVFDSTGAFKGYRGVGKDITERKQAEERIQHLASHDTLTSLPNRAMFAELLNLAIENARRYHRNFAVLFVDLDRFKVINDTLGHDAGDKLLQEMGVRLKQAVRSSDVVARLGGDEFVVLVQEVSEAKQVATVARKILSALIKPMFMQGQECRVTGSVGISMYPADAQDEQSLMKNADIAMYRAKEDGKNNYKFYSEEINVHSFERLAMETSLRRGLDRNEFFLHYQAKLDLHAGTISGVEALVRWQHPELGIVPPMQFIPLAEETGLIVPLGKWVLNAACAQNVAWQRQGLPPLRMSVNISARQFADEGLLDDIAAALKESGMKANLLELELTENMVMQNAERAGKVLAAIKQMGVRLAIDDFGVGYSSLTHLKRFPIDTLKVDRSFIRDIPQDPEDKAITEAIIAMGKSLNLTVVAEGVETLAQQTFLHDHDCDEMQGFYFSKPVSSDQFAELLLKRIESAKQ